MMIGIDSMIKIPKPTIKPKMPPVKPCRKETSKVEVIRCKDCKYNVLADRPYFEDAVSVETYQHCYYLSGMTKQMGYCALAERKEE